MTIPDKIMVCCVVEVVAVFLFAVIPSTPAELWWLKVVTFGVLVLTLGYEAYLKLWKVK